MRAIAAGLSDVGLQREHNEDSFVVLSEHDLFIVADGMGGHRAGDVASRLATETIAEFFRSTAIEDVTWPFHFDSNLSEEENRLLTGIRIANRQIYERSAKSRECRGMGTTVVGALFSKTKNRIYIGHVGDSRCYRIRRNELVLMTRDHSLINDYLIAMPDLTEEQKNELPKNVITRALGMQDQVVVDLQADEPQPGDTYLLCSDGLSGMLADDEILDVLMSTAEIGEGCRRLIARANEHGGEDNITAILVRIDDASTAVSDANATVPPPVAPTAAPPATMRAAASDVVMPMEVRPIPRESTPVLGAPHAPSIQHEQTLPSGTPPGLGRRDKP
jgi:serine/threonine protein phosphatase PrpC